MRQKMPNTATSVSLATFSSSPELSSIAVLTLTATHHRAVANLLSPPRLAPYLRASGGNLRAALKLYQWNVEMSSAVYMMLHLVEVFLRNSIDKQLRAWNATQINPRTGRPHGRDRLLDPSHLVERVVRRDDIDKAARRRGSRSGTPRRAGAR